MNEKFDGFITRIGGKKRTLLLLFVVFTLIMSAIAFLVYARQYWQGFEFGDNTFRIISIDTKYDQKMILEDQNGNLLTFVEEAPSGTVLNRDFSVYYLNDVLGIINRGGERRGYIFSDGSRGHNQRNIALFGNREYALGHVPHFNVTQQRESILLNVLMNFYIGYTLPPVFILVTLVSLAIWLFYACWMFYRQEFHNVFGPFQRVWTARIEEERIANLDGKVSVIALIGQSIIIPILALVMIHVL